MDCKGSVVWCAGTTPILEKKRSENAGVKFSASAKVSPQKGVHAHSPTALEREHWFLQHLSHFIAVNFGRE